MADERPAQPVALPELAALALQQLEPEAADYVFGASGAEDTMRANEEAFRRWRIVPRVLRDVSARDLRVTVLGTEMPAPLGLAPTGGQTMVHPDGELATARAAASLGLPMAVSTVSDHPLEDVAAAAHGPKWFQLYWPRDRELAASLLSRAEEAGYRALIVTVDTVLPSWKPRDLTRAWWPFLKQIGISNYTSDPVFRAMLDKPPEEDPQAAIDTFIAQFDNPTLTWEDLEFVRSRTTLPVALKGVLHADDARLAREHGMDGVIVSNHGGRQLDGAIATLDALPAIVDVTGGEIDVLLDSGVRSGADVVKALALGADAVLLGRPYLWGLAVGGEAGVLAVLRGMLAEIDLTIGLSGWTRPADLDAGLLVRDRP
jgi:lactate 2-monooxygenase